MLLHEALPSLLEVERGDEADVVTLLQPGLPPARVLATHHLNIKQVTSCPVSTQQGPLVAGWLVSPISFYVFQGIRKRRLGISGNTFVWHSPIHHSHQTHTGDLCLSLGYSKIGGPG